MATSGGMNSRIWPTRSSWLAPAASPTTRNRSGLRRTTSSACVPTDPVEPRMESARIQRGYPAAPTLTVRDAGSTSIGLADQPEEVEGRGRDEQDRIEAIQDPTVPREDRPHVLHAHVALQRGFGQVPERGEDRNDHGQPHRVGR